MKKILCIVFALLMCVTLLFTGCNDNSQGGSVEDISGESDVEVYYESDVKIQEGETTVEDDLGEGVEIFLTNNYYLKGTIYSEGTAMPVVLSTDGKNLQFTTDLAGFNFGVLVLEENTYVVLPDSKKYTELSDTLIAALGIEDSISVAEFQAIQNEDSSEEASITQSAVTINGEPGLCTIYTYQDTVVKLYSIGDKLIQVENFDEQGNVTMQIVVEELLGQVPADQLTLKGLEKDSPTAFIREFIGSVA